MCLVFIGTILNLIEYNQIDRSKNMSHREIFVIFTMEHSISSLDVAVPAEQPVIARPAVEAVIPVQPVQRIRRRAGGQRLAQAGRLAARL